MSRNSPSNTATAKRGTRSVGFRAQRSSGPASPKAIKPKSQAEVAATTTTAAAAISSTSPATNRRNAPPMKKRSKGNGFLGVIFILSFSALGYFVWSQLLQYESYGVIDGRVISVAAPWDGTVANWQVRDGEEVTQGQILAQISNLDMEHQLAALGDELKMNQALLEAEISKIKFESQNQNDRAQEAEAEWLKAHGELLAESAKLQELEHKFHRTRRLLQNDHVSRSAYEEIFFQLAGQRKKVEKLQGAVNVLETRSIDATEVDDGGARLKPILADIQLTDSKIARLRERIDQGQIKAPVSGRISKRHCLTGESAKTGETVIEILEHNSIEAVLYVPQRIVDEFEIGKEVDITLEPYHQPVKCVVSRFGDRFQMAPESIKRYYYESEPLLPVFLTPGQDADSVMAIRVGGTVKRPYEYRKAMGKLTEQLKANLEQFRGNSIDSSAKASTDHAEVDPPMVGNTNTESATSPKFEASPAIQSSQSVTNPNDEAMIDDWQDATNVSSL